MIHQSIANIAEICARKDVKHVVLSPGSRCAPLSISFVRHPEISVRTISDERSAAFIALGMAQQVKNPVCLVCTSGSAAYNYAPAVAEAFFQQVPLIIFTADRPPEWIDQLDGQTIRQFGIYGNHIKKSYQLPVSFDHADAQWHSERIISEAINLSTTFPQGPVHINVPLREPLYPSSNDEIIFQKDVKVIDQVDTYSTLSTVVKSKLSESLKKHKKILIVAGQGNFDPYLVQNLQKISEKYKIPVVAEAISNIHPHKTSIKHHDVFLNDDENLILELKPDLLITFGKSVLSKSLKSFLRKNKPSEHWHLQKSGDVADTFQSLTKVIPVKPDYFINEVLAQNAFNPLNEGYLNLWHHYEEKASRFIKDFFDSIDKFGEFSALEILLKSLPDCNLHVANSMAIRYVSLLSLNAERDKIEIFANRGTSGIDGSNSTAVGAAFASKKITTLITGDMAFFYDRNAFWHNYSVPNLKMIVLNNHAGGIFRIIDGPSSLPELEEFFETRQKLEAKNLAEEFGFSYFQVKNKRELLEQLATFFETESTAILEVKTESIINNTIFKTFKTKYRTYEA